MALEVKIADLQPCRNIREEAQFLKEYISLQEIELQDHRKYVSNIKQLIQNSQSQKFYGQSPAKKLIQNFKEASSYPSTIGSQMDDKNGDYLDNLQKERNQLFDISEELYKELKQCRQQRDQFLYEMREKQLLELQTEQKICKLQKEVKLLKSRQRISNQQKVKSQISHQNIHFSRKTRQQDQQKYRSLYQDLKHQNVILQQKVRDLEKKVRESFKAYEQFKNQALGLKKQLPQISNGNKLSVNETKYLIKEISQCLNQKNEKISKLIQVKSMMKEDKSFLQLDKINKETSILFTALFKMPSCQKQKIMNLKKVFESRLESFICD